MDEITDVLLNQQLRDYKLTRLNCSVRYISICGECAKDLNI